MNDGKNSSRRHGVGRPHAIKEKKSSETVSHGEAKPEPDSVSVDSPKQCRTKYNSIGAHCSADIVEYEATQQTSTRVPLMTKRHHQLRMRWTREHHDWSMDQ
ncbi:hypothetical protein TNCV_588921 [Trichonephila clavipes]|nr:hypothetical protein TNCV_588921 [Trichonephila clavipes]